MYKTIKELEEELEELVKEVGGDKGESQEATRREEAPKSSRGWKG